jgi:uncharacterized OB-fold protein
MSEPQLMPAPPENADIEPFWHAAAEGRFVSRRCIDCARIHWYPRPMCPFCSGITEWTDLSGRGRIYSFSRMVRGPEPDVIAYVTLEEGPTILTRLVRSDYETLRIDGPVHVVFETTQSGRPMPCFVADVTDAGR